MATTAHRDRIAALALLLALTAAASLVFVSITTSSLQSNTGTNFHHHRRQLWQLPWSKNAARPWFVDPKSVALRTPSPLLPITSNNSPNNLPIDPSLRRTNCQIVYVLGVEGSIHHGFMPIIKSLAEQQIDPATGTRYEVIKGHESLRTTIFGSKEGGGGGGGKNNFLPFPPQNDPQLVQSTIEEMCPPANEPWKRKIILEGNSFPSGGPDNDALQFRVRRQREWLAMTPDEIAASETALNHPTNLYQLYDAFRPYVDVKFVVLHRPYLETIASHLQFDASPEGHSTVISGFLRLLSRFLMEHLYYNSADTDNTGEGLVPVWTIVCADRLSSHSYDTPQQTSEARDRVIGYLASFLGWPMRNCPTCFDTWKESAKAHRSEERLGMESARVVMEHLEALEGIWPPRRQEDDLAEQQCRS